MSRLIFCLTTKNRTENALRLAQSLSAMPEPATYELVVADFQSSDGLLPTRFPPALRLTLVTLHDRYFNRSRGLNAAAAAANAAPHDILSFIDADMVVPPDYAQQIRAIVAPGRCWFPVCYSLHKDKPLAHKENSRRPHIANGWWRDEGEGMCSITAGDFTELGGWDETIGKTYGGEDNEFGRRASARLERVRTRCQGLFHIWHPTEMSFRARYHQPRVKRRK